MKLLNYNELKTLLLEERDKIPLTVPGARYEMYLPKPNRHGESVRCGIRIALRCMERCQPFDIDDLRPKGRWERKFFTTDRQRVCSICNCTVRQPSYDKGEISLFKYCPHCGADMRGGGEGP